MPLKRVMNPRWRRGHLYLITSSTPEQHEIAKVRLSTPPTSAGWHRIFGVNGCLSRLYIPECSSVVDKAGERMIGTIDTIHVQMFAAV
jgi:hypothetical protein